MTDSKYIEVNAIALKSIASIIDGFAYDLRQANQKNIGRTLKQQANITRLQLETQIEHLRNIAEAITAI